MAVSATAVHRGDVAAKLRVTVTDVVADSSYPTGGEALTAAQLGLSQVAWAIVTVNAPTADAVVAGEYDVTNSKLILYTATAQVSNGTDLTDVGVQVVAFGY